MSLAPALRRLSVDHDPGVLAAFAAVEDGDPARAAAWAAFAAEGLPHRRLEAWKWTDVRAAVAKAATAGSGSGPALPSFESWAHAPALVLARTDGRLAQPCADAPGLDLAHATLPAIPPAGGMASLAVALATEPLRLDIAPGADITAPIVIAETLRGPAPTGGLLEISLGVGARATVIETFATAPDSEDGPGLAARLVRYRLAPGARLERVLVQTGTDRTILVQTAEIDLAPGANLVQTTLGFGGLLIRLETRLEHAGDGASARLDGAYLLSGARHLDLTARVRHTGPGGTTAELYKGAAADRASAVFQGRIEVARAAQQTDARLAHHALLLSEGASVNAKPELEIYADDVQCGHGATVGALDEDALFYLRARGLPAPRARAMLTRAFLAEAFAHAPDAVRESLLEPALDAALDALGTAPDGATP